MSSSTNEGNGMDSGKIIQNYDAVDLLKVILSIFVIALHVIVDVSPWIRVMLNLAVPVFFIISSFFFFSKLKNESNSCMRRRLLENFLFRLLRLYVCWGTIQLPITVKLWKAYGLARGFNKLDYIGHIVKNFFLGSIFFASWFLMALMLSVLLVTVFSKRINNSLLFGFSLVCYIFCTSGSFENLFFYPPRSFLNALLWVMIGKMIAEGNPLLCRVRKMRNGEKRILAIITLLLYYIEFYYNWERLGHIQTILMLPFLSVIIFILAIDSPRRFPRAKFWRSTSTVNYCSHGAVFSVVIAFGNRIGVNFEGSPFNRLAFILTTSGCLITASLVYYMKERKGFQWAGWLC